VLSLPEWCRLGFGPELPDKAARVCLESDWPDRLERMLGSRGRVFGAALVEEFPPLSAAELERRVRNSLVLENATLRVHRGEQALTRYSLLVFRVTCSSDEKREEVLTLCINEENGAFADGLTDKILERLRSGERVVTLREEALLPAWSSGELLEVARRALDSRLRQRLAPFLAGMERRMGRDLDRLHQYHTGLWQETSARLKDRERRRADAGSVDAERSRLGAIEREYRAKVADTERKYAMTVDVRLAQSARIQMPVQRAGLTLLRRKGIRTMLLDWNPATRNLDTLPCERCLSVPRTYRLCDEKLHCLCNACLAPCPSCRREVCLACSRSQCGRCGRALPAADQGRGPAV
jgi:hypothetical protein